MIEKGLLATLAIPIVALASMVFYQEINLRLAQPWLIRIEGYDPRDILRGQYLQFRYQWDFAGQDECGSNQEGLGASVDPSCCLCFSSRKGNDFPYVRNVECGTVQNCESWVQGRIALDPQSYFISEAEVANVTDVLQKQGTAMRIRVNSQGRMSIERLVSAGKL